MARVLRLGTLLAAPLALTAVSQPAQAAANASPESAAPVMLMLAVILVVAKLGGHLAARIGQPAVLGEILGGIVVGNAHYIGWQALEPIRSNSSIDLLAQLGVVLLLFEVGLESTVSEMLGVGRSALLVATLGVAAPIGLGWGVGRWLLPNSDPLVHLFLGATLCATSVGITARVLHDLGKSATKEARIILGAAVVDDVLGLLVLAVVTAAVAATDAGDSMRLGALLTPLGKAFLFLIGSLALGIRLSPMLFRWAARLRSSGVLIAVGLAFCFLLSWGASAIGLAPVVGAFAAGLVLEDAHFRGFVVGGESQSLRVMVQPIEAFLAPVFFVVVGIRTDLGALASPRLLVLSSALTAAAIVGKQACAAGILERHCDRLSVGIGMIPRGEVGLIFANIGMGMHLHGVPIMVPSTYASVVVMVMVTTMITPPALGWSMRRWERRACIVSR